MKMFLFLLVAFLLARIPYIGKYFSMVNTLIHESGHALFSFLTKGKVYSVSLFVDASGVANSGSRNKFGSFVTSFAGYPFASFVSFLFIYLYSNKNLEYIAYFLFFIILSNLLFWVRNFYGILWVLSFGLLLLFFYKLEHSFLFDYFILLTISICLIESLFTSFYILYLSKNDPQHAGDAANLKKITRIPILFWGVLFFLISCFFFYLSLNTMFK